MSSYAKWIDLFRLPFGQRALRCRTCAARFYFMRARNQRLPPVMPSTLAKPTVGAVLATSAAESWKPVSSSCCFCCSGLS